MPKQILAIHGGDAFETYEAYLNNLKNVEMNFARLMKRDWKSRLQETLGDEYQIVLPRFPNAQNARYAEWKIWFDKIIPFLDDNVVLIGHSLGAIFLVKWFSENKYPKKVKAMFLVATPYNTATDNPFVDFNLEKNFDGLVNQVETIFMYHSKDDKAVPFSAFERYTKEIPTIVPRALDGRGHFTKEEFREIIEDIRNLK